MLGCRLHGRIVLPYGGRVVYDVLRQHHRADRVADDEPDSVADAIAHEFANDESVDDAHDKSFAEAVVISDRIAISESYREPDDEPDKLANGIADDESIRHADKCAKREPLGQSQCGSFVKPDGESFGEPNAGAALWGA